ncbi:hypothetical protein GNF10_32020 [Nostoc sp. UCD121]|uniref:hypothetical protein n=1 Tax=unclassified Nostoc TaxID=2593658 RepID=UPI0016276EBB|nr:MULTISPECIES: hypothetical protein [unclassified Nostoc]MBC1221640.1 hypothetical protein [Nostoc sp. UCD120]MBC1280444.1 hypothetical protein [Nostoc sp. UCD121]MBC1299706.1 hypothetical protein [Nostoc sp. UCD122]MBD2512023.1 hypothetical protein [Desmonostoc muscorum FACHB-395]
MKLYATSIPQALPIWATVISNDAGLIEVEINDQDPGFHSMIEELSTEIQPGVIGVKASDLCQILSIEMVDSNEEN